MALNRKYAALPDLDSAPDIYETPDLTEDNSTIPTGTVRLQSPSSSYKDYDDDEGFTPHISRDRLHPDEARSLFEPAQIDARDVDFSDRITGKRKSYKTSTRRQRKGDEELGDFSDEDDGESLERKLARLRRELEEVKEEAAKRRADKQNAPDVNDKSGDDNGMDEAAALSKMLDTISTNPTNRSVSVGTLLAKDLETSLLTNGAPAQSNATQKEGDAATYTVTYAPTYQQTHALAKAADFDTRLALLERVLGITETEMPIIDSNGIPKAILPKLDSLERQVSVVSESSASSLDNISRGVRLLTQEAEKLEEARRSAKAAHDALKAAGIENGDGVGASNVGADTQSQEQVAKINALYGTLPTIENLAPLLPALLDRLRSLRAIHADAAKATETLEAVEKRQEDMTVEIGKWREGLARVEESMKEGERTMAGNVKVVEGWVKELEAKMGTLR